MQADLLKVEFDIPDKYLAEVLDWTASNATRLFNIGYNAGLNFSNAHAGKLGRGTTPRLIATAGQSVRAEICPGAGVACKRSRIR